MKKLIAICVLFSSCITVKCPCKEQPKNETANPQWFSPLPNYQWKMPLETIIDTPDFHVPYIVDTTVKIQLL